MGRPAIRTRAVVEHELLDARQHQKHAAATQDFDAYGHLTEQINDLIEELAPLLPKPRTGT